MNEITTKTENNIPMMNDLILKKQRLSAQAGLCYDEILESSKEFNNPFCVQFGILVQMIEDL